MWFKNLSVFRLPDNFHLTPETLETALEPATFAPCPKHQPASMGWTAPLGKDAEQLVHTTNGRMMVCLKREERVLPAASLRERLEEKLDAIEQAEGRRVRGKEKLRLKEEITLDMLPLAFTRSRTLSAYIDPANRLFVVDSATSAKIDELIGLLRQCLGSFAVRPLQVNTSPAAAMTTWLADGTASDGFSLGEDCVLKDPQNEASVIRMRRHSLQGDEIRVHLESGKRASQLAVEFAERISAVLDEGLLIRRLRFLDLVLDAAEADELETAADRFDAEFALMGAELAPFITAMINAFGGEAD